MSGRPQKAAPTKSPTFGPEGPAQLCVVRTWGPAVLNPYKNQSAQAKAYATQKKGVSCGAARWCKTKKLADVAIERFGDLVLGDRADDLLDHLAILENQQRGDTADVETTRRIHGLVHVQLGDLKLARIVLGDLGNRGSQHVARTAPLCPKIDHDWLSLAGRQHLRLKIPVIHRKYIICHKFLCFLDRLRQGSRFPGLIRCRNYVLVSRCEGSFI